MGFVVTMISFQLLTVLPMFEAFGAPQLARDPSARYLVTPPSGYLNGELRLAYSSGSTMPNLR